MKIIGPKKLQNDAKILCDKIITSGEVYDSIIILTRGGLHLGYYVADYLGIRNIQTLAISSPHSGEDGYTIHHLPGIGASKRYLIIDDLIDTGGSLNQVIHNILPRHNYGIAVLYEKPNHTFTGCKVFSAKKLRKDYRIKFYYESK